MKKIASLFFIMVFGFGFIGAVNAAEADLSDVAIVTSVIGGSETEITTRDDVSSNTYKYYYKVVAIDDNDFASYVNSKFIYDNGDPNSDDYVNAQSQVLSYEENFYGYVPELTSSASLNDWTESTDGQITLSNLKYEAGKHHGYVLGVAAVKTGDNNTVYVTRIILESQSATTLSSIEYNNNDMTQYNDDTDAVVNDGESKSKSNPETGIEDYAIYLVPVLLIGGSAIIFRKSYA